jgi:hypothetical protein
MILVRREAISSDYLSVQITAQRELSPLGRTFGMVTSSDGHCCAALTLRISLPYAVDFIASNVLLLMAGFIKPDALCKRFYPAGGE